jgi:Prephenate dehydrogenase
MENNKIFNTVTIIGMGLIGSSICRAAKHFEVANKIIVYDKDPDVLRKVGDLKIADIVCKDLNESVSDSDLVFIATPVGSFPS